MGVARGDAGRVEADRLVRDQPVGAGLALTVAAFHQHRAGAHGAQPRALILHLGIAARLGKPEKRRRLGQVRRQQVGAWQKMHDQRRARRRGQQPRPGLGDHHRIEHHRALVVTQGVRHRRDQTGLAQHADLDRVDADVAQHRRDLRGDAALGDWMHIGHRAGVLRGDGGDHAGAKDAERGEGLEIGLNARAAATVGACDRQRCRRHPAFLPS